MKWPTRLMFYMTRRIQVDFCSHRSFAGKAGANIRQVGSDTAKAAVFCPASFSTETARTPSCILCLDRTIWYLWVPAIATASSSNHLLHGKRPDAWEDWKNISWHSRCNFFHDFLTCVSANGVMIILSSLEQYQTVHQFRIIYRSSIHIPYSIEWGVTKNLRCTWSWPINPPV